MSFVNTLLNMNRMSLLWLFCNRSIVVFPRLKLDSSSISFPRSASIQIGIYKCWSGGWQRIKTFIKEVASTFIDGGHFPRKPCRKYHFKPVLRVTFLLSYIFIIQDKEYLFLIVEYFWSLLNFYILNEI